MEFSADPQVDFAGRLAAARTTMLREARQAAVKAVDVEAVDAELRKLAPERPLRSLASIGIRGEVVFATPVLLRKAPRLLGYYRLLLGYSQKEFYQGPVTVFRKMEADGIAGGVTPAQLSALCRAMNKALGHLVERVSDFSADQVHELQLLTLGPQFRGSKNNRIGQDAAGQLLTVIGTAAGKAVKSRRKERLEIVTRSRERVTVSFATDPDISIVKTVNDAPLAVLAIEIKGGKDVSNVHNRLGEAEKSHQKAKAKGYLEFWTVLQARVKEADAKRESPTRTRFYTLSGVLDRSSSEHQDFVAHLKARIGLK
jgi:hypothetical protein